MKIKTVCIALISATILSCSNKEKQNLSPEEIISKTPEMLDRSQSGIGSWSKRYDSDIITKLYEEALEKNENLKLLNTKIKDIRESSIDSSFTFNKYTQANNRYWLTVNNYIENINDSILKQSTKTLFSTLESNYKTSISKHEEEFININKSRLMLEDQLILMKLITTQPMISNYQKNELPDIKSLKKINEEYNGLIEQTKLYSEIKGQ